MTKRVIRGLMPKAPKPDTAGTILDKHKVCLYCAYADLGPGPSWVCTKKKITIADTLKGAKAAPRCELYIIDPIVMRNK